ncbi:LOW QUALITY PROTEIN: Fanconi anemia group B protein [Lates calcarifer]|uniref:LOW QUALITY PROTEIN: Fanconi anemia group B protein n=1 Tax=Lates calcarifer TaxID=8187 RepID=A0AAJ8B5X6_LATCA|nr:LOW QUALITY PROTEIN: Fanconi anemia group B protein [Lates calcarifer]
MERSGLGDLHQYPHRVSLYGKIILFNCKRASGTNDGERSELMFNSFSFGRDDNAFLKAADGAAVLSRKTSAHVDIVKCKCVTDVQKRVTTPCVLVTQKSDKGESFRYSLFTLSSSNQLEPCIEFKLPYQIRDTVSILQGPTVLWSHGGYVFYTSLQTGKVRQIPIQLSHCVIGELPFHKGELFILGLQDEINQSTSKTLGYFVENTHTFDGTVILPHPYFCITRCVLVLSADKVDGVLKSAVVAVTSNQQLVYFENGIVKDICQLPFEQPEDIQVMNTGRNGCLFVISFHQGHVCAVWKETFQASSHWSGVSSVHVDDFLGCGTDQMLLVFKDEGVTGQPLEDFLITDLCGISYSHGWDTGAPKKLPSPPENHLLTLQALESRLQSGLTVLQELQREMRVKERVVQQSIQALTDVVSERKPVLTQPEQEGLVALWDSDDESKEEALDDKTQDMPAVSSKPQVDKLWHRFAEDQMVVGVILTTDSSVPVASVSLAILTETGQSSTPAVIQTQSQVLLLPAPCPSSSSSSSSSSAFTFPEPAAKRSKQHNASRPNDLNTCRLAVTAVTKLTPLLNSGCVKCRVMLHYVQRQDAFSLVSNPAPVVLHCGQVALDIHTDFQTQLLKNPELKTDEVEEDLLSLLAVLDCWVLHIDSPDHSIGDIDGWIQKRVGCKRIEVSSQYLLLNSSGPSALMLLHWHQITPFQGELSVHSSQLQMLQFLDSFLAHLPVSCSIQPVKGTRGQGAAQMFSLALEKEVVSLRECVSLLLCEEEEDEKRRSPGHDVTPVLGTVEGLQRCREAWQQDVERSRMRLSPLLDVGRYRKLIQSLSKVCLDGDLAALL